MISEVENIMNGQVVRKVEADKAIGVSTANLTPNEKGEVPLSKQTVFQIGNMTQTSLVTEELDLTPSSGKEFDVQVAPTTPVINDTISDSPVDVVAPTQLSGLEMDSIIPNIPLVSDEDVNKEKAEELVVDRNVELPKMPETILAEEPTVINDNLFVNSQSIPTPVIPSMEQSREETPIEVNLTSDIPSVDNAPQEMVNVPTLSSVSEIKDETPTEVNLTSDIPSVDNAPQEIITTPAIPTLNASEELEKNTQEKNVNLQQKNQDEKDKKIDMILKKLDEINISLNNILEKIVETNIKEQTSILPQESTPIVSSSVSSTEPIAEKPEEMVDALSQIGNIEELNIDDAPIKGGMFI